METDDDDATIRERFSLVQSILFIDFTDILPANFQEKMVESCGETMQFGLVSLLPKFYSFLRNYWCPYKQYNQIIEDEKRQGIWGPYKEGAHFSFDDWYCPNIWKDLGQASCHNAVTITIDLRPRQQSSPKPKLTTVDPHVPHFKSIIRPYWLKLKN